MVPEFLFSLRGKFWSHRGRSSYSKDIIKGVCAVCICTYVYVTYIIYIIFYVKSRNSMKLQHGPFRFNQKNRVFLLMLSVSFSPAL